MIEQQQIEYVTLGTPSGEEPGAQIAFVVPDVDLADGAALSLLRADLEESERILVVYSVDPASVATMTSNSGKRDAIANAIKAAAEAL